jgi:hypothetical protein
MIMQMNVVIKAIMNDIKIFSHTNPLINIQLSPTESAPFAFINDFTKIIINGTITNNKVIITKGINKIQLRFLW